MYTAHFQLTSNPFSSSSASGFIYRSRQIEEVLAHFDYALEMEEAFVLLTGEVGTGKSTAIQALLQSEFRNKPVAVLSHTTLTPRELLFEIARRFGLPVKSRDTKPDLIHRLETHFARLASGQHRAVLFLDEAHLLAPAVLEEVRLLSNLKREGRPLVLICLVGQPELATRLEQRRLRQLRQRIAVRYVLKPLSREETRDYLTHRLRAADCPGPTGVFQAEAANAIYEITRGVPLEINTLAGQAMLSSYLEEARQVTRAHVISAKSDNGFEGLNSLSGSRGGRKKLDLPLMAKEPLPDS